MNQLKTILKSKVFKSIVPDNFVVPQQLITEDFLIRPLTIDDVDKDYDAVMTSINHLKNTFGPALDWPSSTMTREEDLASLGWHQTEFSVKTSFAYTVFNVENDRCLGCIYIFPSDRQNVDVEVYCWIRASEADNLDQKLFAVIQNWLKEVWPFKSVIYPGRTTSWEEFKKI